VHDYANGAIGMRYRNNVNTGGVIVDGVPATVNHGAIGWEQVSGEQGTFTIVHDFDSNLPNIQVTTFYADEGTPDWVQCTGDSQALGTSGGDISSPEPLLNTDPRNDPHYDFTALRTQYYDAPNQTLADAQQRNAWARAPLETATVLWTS
jgi:hypothetical protein